MKKAIIIALLAFLMLSLTGCVQVYDNVVFEEDGSLNTKESYIGLSDFYFTYSNTIPDEYWESCNIDKSKITTKNVDGFTYYYYENPEENNFLSLDAYMEKCKNSDNESVKYEFYEKDGEIYHKITFPAEASALEFSNDLLKDAAEEETNANLLASSAIDENLMATCAMKIHYTFTNGLVDVLCSEEDLSCITKDENSVKIDLLKRIGNSPIVVIGKLTDESLPFSDVPKGSYFAKAVKWALKNNITSGTSENTFSPDDACTRAQAVTFLWKAAGCPEPTSSNNPFSDVTESDWFYKAVLWAVENKITSGTSETTFSPQNTCKNSHILTFIWNANGKPDATENPESWYSDALSWASKNGLLEEITNADKPDELCPRKDIVTFLYRYLGK